MPYTIVHMAQAVDALGFIHPITVGQYVLLCSVVMVNRRNVSCQTRDYDDDEKWWAHILV